VTPQRPAETALTCELCGEPAVYCDSIPDASLPRIHPSECGYRLQALCWLHGAERKQVATSRVNQILRCEGQGIGRLDRDRCGGDVLCLDCGRKFYDHPQEEEHRYMNVLCDGSVVKL
jgi:hypothetical protein